MVSEKQQRTPLMVSPEHNGALDIWRFQRVLSTRLLAWAGLNILGGAWLQQQQNKVLRGVGIQAISWGAINALIAVGGTVATNLRLQKIEKPEDRALQRKERQNLTRILWINAGLDVLYMLGGTAWALTRGKQDRLQRGNGWGVVIQGAFLFVFDIVHALILTTEDQPTRE
jgi:hypothetical protein